MYDYGGRMKTKKVVSPPQAGAQSPARPRGIKLPFQHVGFVGVTRTGAIPRDEIVDHPSSDTGFPKVYFEECKIPKGWRPRKIRVTLEWALPAQPDPKENLKRIKTLLRKAKGL